MPLSVLKNPHFLVLNDASETTGLGAMLFQEFYVKEHLVIYISRKLSYIFVLE